MFGSEIDVASLEHDFAEVYNTDTARARNRYDLRAFA
jgi:hypothetical protein